MSEQSKQIEAQKREDMLMDMYKLHAYIPNDAEGNPLTPFGNFCAGYEAATAEANKRIEALESEVAELKGEKVRHDQLVDYLKAGIAEELEQRILELQANNHDLREALKLTLGVITGETLSKSFLTKALEKSKMALNATPAESLQAHDAETIKRYADDLDSNHWVFIPHDLRKPLKEGK